MDSLWCTRCAGSPELRAPALTKALFSWRSCAHEGDGPLWDLHDTGCIRGKDIQTPKPEGAPCLLIDAPCLLIDAPCAGGTS